MFKLYTYFLSCLFLIIASNTFGQVVKTVDQPESGNQTHIAKEKVRFVPGYGYIAVGTDKMVAYTLPIFVQYSTTQETSDTLGSIELFPISGKLPYYFFWNDGDQSHNRYNLESGLYGVTVIDSLNDSISFVIPVDVDVQIADSQGVAFNNRYLEKTAVDGWGNGKMSFSNVVKGNGAVRVEIVNDNKEWAFGYRLSANAQAVYYDSLDYGFYINSGDTLYTWNKLTSTLTNVGSVKAGDILSIEREGGLVIFKKNDELISEVSVSVDNEYRLDFTMYSNQARIRIHVIIFSFRPRPSAVITHITSCNTSNDGAIDLTVTGGVVPYTYSWIGPNGFTASTQDIFNLEAGQYTVTITDGWSFLPPVIRIYNVGYKVSWTTVIGANTTGNSISKPSTPNGWGTSGASSVNQLKEFFSGWIDFSVPTGVNILNYSAIGFSDVDNDQTLNDIDYGLAFFTTQIVLPSTSFYYNRFWVTENGSQVTPQFAFQTNDKFRIEWVNGSNDVIYYKNNVPIYTSSSVPLPSSGLFVVDAALYTVNSTINDVNVSFGCPQPFIYGHLRKKLDGGFYRAVNNMVYLKYLEEYNSLDFEFNIYDDMNVLVANQNNLSINTYGGYGDNRIEIGLVGYGANLNPGYYVLEVINDKKEKWYLRFKY